jgi:alkaline phosphatase
MKFKFTITVVRDGAVIADSKAEATAIVTSTFAKTYEGGFKVSELKEVKHKIPVGKCPASYPRKG